jgi:hypothetical protein
MDEERINGIIGEVRDLLLDGQPDFGAVLGLASELGLPDEEVKHLMEDIKMYMNHKIHDILENMGYPSW